MNVTIYHNPGCSKSRKTLELLRERDIEPTIVEYLETPPDALTLRSILAMLSLAPRGLMRTKEGPFDVLNLADPDLSEDALIEAMIEHPILIERPIVVAENRAVIGRPPENIHALFDT